MGSLELNRWAEIAFMIVDVWSATREDNIPRMAELDSIQWQLNPAPECRPCNCAIDEAPHL